MDVDEPPVQCSDPETAIAVSEQPIAVERLTKASNGIGLGSASNEPSDSARHGDQQLPFVTVNQIFELR